MPSHSRIPMIFTSPENRKGLSLTTDLHLWLWRVRKNIPITIHSNSKSLARKNQKMKFSSLASAALLLVSSSEAFTPISLSSRLVLSACDIYIFLSFLHVLVALNGSAFQLEESMLYTLKNNKNVGNNMVYAMSVK